MYNEIIVLGVLLSPFVCRTYRGSLPQDWWWQDILP